MTTKKQLNEGVKEKQVHLRVTVNEREQLHAIADKFGYKSTSKYMLDCSLDPVLFVENIKPFLEIESHIARIGTNINQVARKVNTLDYVMNEDLNEIKRNQVQLRAYIKLLKDFRFFEKASVKEIYTHGDNKNSSD